MNPTLKKIITSREDISEYLFHFTKGSAAFDTLLKILEDNTLKDVRQTGVICFTEAPLTVLADMFDIFSSYPNPYYSPYGVAIKKSKLFEMGGRPVIYGLPEEEILLDERIRWRFEKYHPESNDFSWLREWRVPTPSITLNRDDFFVITKTKDELGIMFNPEDILDVEFDGDVADGQFWGYAYAVVGRRFKAISLEDIKEVPNPHKSDMFKNLDGQNLNDTVNINLGSTGPL